MNPTLPLWVLLVGAPTTFSPSSGDAGTRAVSQQMQSELRKFSAGWSVRFREVSPIEEPAREDGTLAERVEALLAAAQTALGALRTTEAEESLTEAERLLEAHPELPQAAWLSAERAELAADLVEPRDPDAARALRMRAMLLAGRRVAPFRDGSRAETPLPDAPTSRVTIRGISPRDELEWDSEPRTAPLDASPGVHQLRVLRGSRAIWSRWVVVEGAVQEIAVGAPELVPCSADDLVGTAAEARGARAPLTTRCPRWAVARYDGAKLVVSLCRESSCGPWQSAPADPAQRPPAQPAQDRSFFPRWAIYTAAGIGAAALTTFVVIQSGVFASGPSSERWVYGGLR